MSDTLAVGPNYHITGVDPNTGALQFGEAAFVAMDHAIAIAAEHGIKLIIPIINNHFAEWGDDISHYGDYAGFAHLFNRHWKCFFTDRVVIDAFKQLLTFLLNRVNTVSGVRYGDDPAILAWQTGNELGGHTDDPPPGPWTLEIARHIKQLAPHTLVADGTLGWDNRKARWQKEALAAPEVDIFVNHYQDKRLEKDADYVAGCGKVFIYGEFGLYTPASPYDGIYKRVIRNKNVAGALLWSLRFHSAEGGFYTHSEGYGYEHGEPDDFYCS
ncbi:hypothetical protein HK104_006491, partial [Borealophlyctis nickersoniae]